MLTFWILPKKVQSSFSHLLLQVYPRRFPLPYLKIFWIELKLLAMTYRLKSIRLKYALSFFGILPSSIGGWTDEDFIVLDEKYFLGFLFSVTWVTTTCSPLWASYKWNISPYWDLLLDGAFFFPWSSAFVVDSSLISTNWC